jgi:ABC-2 type transport system permease protein
MRRIWAVVLKELRQAARDRLTLAMLLGVPAMMLLLYGYALNFDVKHIALAVQDEDRTQASRTLTDGFFTSGYFDRALDIQPGTDLARLTEMRRAAAVLVIPRGYGRALADGRTSEVQLVLDGTDALTATTVLGYAQAIVAELDGRRLRETVIRLGAGETTPIESRPRVWYNPELQSTQFLVPGLIGFILMLTAVISTALSVVREKERGTMEQLRVTALRTPQLIVGKVLPYLAISLAATAVILLTARVLFGVEVRGSYLALFAATLLYLVGALSFGLLVSSFSDTQAMAFQVGAVSSMLPAIFLSGFIFPIRGMPEVLQYLTYAVPTRHYLVVLRGVVLKGTDLSPYGRPMLYLGLYAAVVLAVASVRLARREG